MSRFAPFLQYIEQEVEMETEDIPMWQIETEAILREKFQGDELSERLKKSYELINIASGMEPPQDTYGEIAGIIMKLATRELPPLASTYTGFMLGVAYVRCQNANLEQKEEWNLKE
jgi:hypothetical protein